MLEMTIKAGCSQKRESQCKTSRDSMQVAKLNIHQSSDSGRGYLQVKIKRLREEQREKEMEISGELKWACGKNESHSGPETSHSKCKPQISKSISYFSAFDSVLIA